MLYVLMVGLYTRDEEVTETDWVTCPFASLKEKDLMSVQNKHSCQHD